MPGVTNIFDGTQKDASEFLVKLIEKLYTPDASTLIEQFTVYTAKNATFEKNVDKSLTTWYLPIGLHEMSNSDTLADLINKQDEVTVQADEGDATGTFTRSHYFSKLPTHLMLSFNRFNARGHKISNPLPLDSSKLIQLVESDLNRDNKPVPKKNVWYKIETIVVHIGNSSGSGHYVCNIRDGDTFFTHSDAYNPRQLPRDYKGADGYFYHLVKVKEEIIIPNNQ
jgi:uncharacterized UBP type Zn finger protein